MGGCTRLRLLRHEHLWITLRIGEQSSGGRLKTGMQLCANAHHAPEEPSSSTLLGVPYPAGCVWLLVPPSVARGASGIRTLGTVRVASCILACGLLN